MKSLDQVVASADRHRLDDITRQHLTVRFRCTPETMPPELHKVVAHWLRVIERASGGDQDRRTIEAVRALMQMTDWTELDARLAMRTVAEHLSPKESTHDDAAATGPAAAPASDRFAGGTLVQPRRGR